MRPELVSVIMPTFNASKYLADSIESILSQTYTNLELLITDDCSTDDTRNILKEFAQRDKRVKVKFLKTNSGPAIARNKSIERAKGRYIAFCDCDDRWFPEKLERQIALMTRKDCALCSSSYLICDDDNKVIGINKNLITAFILSKYSIFNIALSFLWNLNLYAMRYMFLISPTNISGCTSTLVEAWVFNNNRITLMHNFLLPIMTVPLIDKHFNSLLKNFTVVYFNNFWCCTTWFVLNETTLISIVRCKPNLSTFWE